MEDGEKAAQDPVSDPDTELMLAFAAGNEGAFTRLYERYRDRIVNYARRMLGDQARAEEAAQDVFIKLYRSRQRYEPRSRFSTYLFRIATNHCLNMNARLDRKLVNRGVDDARHVDPRRQDQADAVAQRQLRERLGAALNTLPDKQRAALVLVHYEGMSYREAAGTIEVSESALKSLIHRARGAMMQQLKDVMTDDAEVSHAM